MLEARVCIRDYGILRAGIAQQSATKTKELVKSLSDSEQRDTVSEDEDKVTSGKQAPISFKRPLPSNPNPADNSSIPKKRKTWSSCNHCRNLDAIPRAWQQEVKRNDPIDLHVGMCILLVFMYSQQQFGLCDVHFLKLCERVQLSGSKPAILSIRVNQLWEARSSHASLVQFVQNHREWFPTKMLFETEQTVASCAGALPVGALPISASPGSPQCLGDESKDLTADNSPGHGAGAVADATPPGFPRSLGDEPNEPPDVRANVDSPTDENGPASKPIVKTISGFHGYVAAPRTLPAKASTTLTCGAKTVQPDKRGML